MYFDRMRSLPGICLAALLALVGTTGTAHAGCTLAAHQFDAILADIAGAWNAGRGADAARHFGADALYTEPPGRQHHAGRAAIAKFFAESTPTAAPDRMTWRGFAFDADRQRGFAEYTYRGGQIYHGIVAIEFKDCQIALWREYQRGTALEWEDFVAADGRSR